MDKFDNEVIIKKIGGKEYIFFPFFSGFIANDIYKK
jgi:hypothetical protein